MAKKKQKPRDEKTPRKTAGRSGETSREDVEKAHKEADRDIADDPEFSAHSPNDDLDEGETARLGENNTGLI
jgi:hypothetical protein